MRLHPALLLSLLLPGLAAATDYPRHILPTTQVQAAVEESKNEPLRYAVALPTNLNAPDGTWDSPAEGIARWRLGIESQGAQSLALRLEDLRLPAGSALRWVGEDSGDVQGPFVAADSGTLWLPVVRGGRALLELRLPAALKQQFGVRIAEAQHGYRGFPMPGMAKGQFGDAVGACHVDVACAAANDWLPQTRSVVLLTAGGSALCTGTLVNNVREDETPYVLSANHCNFQTRAIGSIRAYFNVNRSGCGRGSDGGVTQNVTAAELVARSEIADFALLRLSSSVTGFNVYFAGWDASGDTPSSGAAIHHPRGDNKKISLYGGGVTRQDDVDFDSFTVDAWAVRWRRGTTERGSSGAALWNQNGRVVGTLSGGSAACNGSSPDDNPDYFGRLDLAWATNSASNAQLKAHLDPDNSGASTLAGLNRGLDPEPNTDTTSSSGGGALPALALAGLIGLGLLRRRARHLRP